MELTPNEQRMLRRLRQQHQNWTGIRTITLICTIGLIVMALLAWREGAPWYSLVLWAGLISGLLSYTIGGWYGRPEISLLLKLIDSATGSRDRTDNTDGAA